MTNHQTEFPNEILEVIRKTLPWVETVYVTGDKHQGSLSIPFNSQAERDALMDWVKARGAEVVLDPETGANTWHIVRKSR